MTDATVRDLANATRPVAMIAPAGYGKTWSIAAAVAQSRGRQLVLTHTHAGVRAIKVHLVARNVAVAQYHVQTLDAFARHLTTAFPGAAALHTEVEPDWQSVRHAAIRALSTAPARRVMRASYAGCFVDEYQDCSAIQHQLVCAIGELMPLRVVGDPLQGIFDFDEPLVDWARDVAGCFELLPSLTVPWRWRHNEKLAAWVIEIRSCLETGLPVRFDMPIFWYEASDRNRINACRFAAQQGGSVVAIHNVAERCHRLARSLRGRFSSVEELQSKALAEWTRRLDTSGPERATAVFDFARLCLGGIGKHSGVLRRVISGGQSRSAACAAAAPLLEGAARSDDPRIVHNALRELRRLPGVFVARADLWSSMGRALRIQLRTPGMSLSEAGSQVRRLVGLLGRRPLSRTVSRTVLVKGLEFDHVVVLDAESLKDPRHLYVALTRGSRSVSVVSQDRRLTVRTAVSEATV